MNKFKQLLVGAGLATSDEPLVGSQPTAASPLPPPRPQPQVPPLQVVQTGGADAGMVNSLKARVLGASPIIGQFMQNVEIVRTQFPNDESACMKAALAFTRVDGATLLGELDRPVAAAFLQAKKATEGARQKAHDATVGSLQQQISAVNEEVAAMEAQLAQLQQSIANKKVVVADLQGKAREAEADLFRQDNVVGASFAQVEQYITLLKQMFAKL